VPFTAWSLLQSNRRKMGISKIALQTKGHKMAIALELLPEEEQFL
jgi:hypothetical protein